MWNFGILEFRILQLYLSTIEAKLYLEQLDQFGANIKIKANQNKRPSHFFVLIK